MTVPTGLLLPLACLSLQAQAVPDHVGELDRALASRSGLGWVLEVQRPIAGHLEAHLILRGADSFRGSITPAPALAGSSIQASLGKGSVELRDECDLPSATSQALLNFTAGGTSILAGTPLPATGETLRRTWTVGLAPLAEAPATGDAEVEVRLERCSDHEVQATLEVHHGSVAGVVLQELQRGPGGKVTASQLALTVIAPASKGIVLLSGPVLISGSGARVNLHLEGRSFNAINVDLTAPTVGGAPTVRRIPLRRP